MTTMSGQGACPNAGPVARLQAELEQVEGQLELARADTERVAASAISDIAALHRRLADQERHNIASRRSLVEQSDRYLAERDSARALVPETLVCW